MKTLVSVLVALSFVAAIGATSVKAKNGAKFGSQAWWIQQDTDRN